MAGKMLGASDKKLDLMLKQMKRDDKNLSDISRNTKKMVTVQNLYSPYLKQQFVILKRSMELFLRPIGDSIGRWLAPMARSIFAFTQWFYKVYKNILGGKKKTDLESPEAMIDRYKQLEEEKKVAEEEGDTARVKIIQDAEDEIARQLYEAYQNKIRAEKLQVGQIDGIDYDSKELALKRLKQALADAGLEWDGHFKNINSGLTTLGNGVSTFVSNCLAEKNRLLDLNTGRSTRDDVPASPWLSPTGSSLIGQPSPNDFVGPPEPPGNDFVGPPKPSTVSIVNNVQATINNPYDIKQLARELATCQSSEIRRGISI